MTGFTLAIVALFSAPIGCPPDVGQIRWDGVSHGLRADGIVVEGTVWDRDRDGRPSAGDVMRIDDARRKGSSMPIDEVWVVLKGKLAKGVAREMKRQKHVRSACETPFAIEGVPAFESGKALARHLRGQAGGDAAPLSKADRARADIAGWAAQLCRSKRSISRKDLQVRLETHAARKLKSVERRTRQRLAAEVAREYAMECSKMAVPDGLTFD